MAAFDAFFTPHESKKRKIVEKMMENYQSLQSSSPSVLKISHLGGISLSIPFIRLKYSNTSTLVFFGYFPR